MQSHKLLPSRNRKPRRIRIWLGALALAIGLTLLAWSFAVQDARRLLSKDSGPVKADIMIVLGGGWNERSERAAELFKEGAAPRVLISGKGDCEKNRSLLVAAGVPRTAMEVEGESESTKENALFAARILRKEGVHQAILVTTWYHSRRTLACFRHYAPDIEFYSRPSYYASDRSEWKSKSVAPYVRKEFLKLAGYWIFYGVRPW